MLTKYVILDNCPTEVHGCEKQKNISRMKILFEYEMEGI